MQKAKNDKLQQQLDEATNNWKRVLADYQNLEKRTKAEKEEFDKYANKELILKILPVLDSLEKLDEHLKNEGVSLVLRQFRDILAKEGLEKIEVLGQEFNPEEMECVDVVSGNDENKIVEEVRPGYRFRGRVLRVAQVKVGKKKTDQN